MFFRFNSTLSQYDNKARRFIREHTRISAAVAAVTVVAGIGAVAGPAPLAEAAVGTATANFAGPETPAGQAGGTIVRSIFGVHLKSDGGQGGAAAPGQPTPSQPTPSQPSSSQPFLFYDSVDPFAVPAGQPIATYADGPFAVSPAEVAGHSQVLWIDVNGSDPEAGALDVEPGDATPGIAAEWAQERLTEQPNATAIIYTTLGEWAEVQAAIATLPSSMQSQVKYWVADPDGVPHMVPGASATQWAWEGAYDINTAEPGLF